MTTSVLAPPQGGPQLAAYPVFMGIPAAVPEPARPAPAVCSQCGTMAETAPLDWVLDVEPRRGRQWICAGCARTYLRAIEAKLQPEWW